MSSNGPLGRYKDGVSRDADDISGFFNTRLGRNIGLGLLGLIVVGTVVSTVVGWVL